MDHRGAKTKASPKATVRPKRQRELELKLEAIKVKRLQLGAGPSKQDGCNNPGH